jgi:Ca-activated chloride channel family protein
VREIPVEIPEGQTQHDVLASLWARTRIEDLMSQDYNGAQQGSMRPELKETITNLGLEYRLMTQFTSFVAVEEMIVTEGGQPRRIDVPIEVPEGVNRDAISGREVNGPLNASFGRGVQNFALLAPGKVSETVNVTTSRAKSSRAVKERGANPPAPNASPMVVVEADAAEPLECSRPRNANAKSC